ncbi:hypothetical protein ACFV2B_14355 [Streptomyces lavendulae]|uniref:hypothetical protein n=1 Tax=Streptomyces lavendulae TaxID=1914 RepID=UPI0036793022
MDGLINPRTAFVRRIRLHQLVAGTGGAVEARAGAGRSAWCRAPAEMALRTGRLPDPGAPTGAGRAAISRRTVGKVADGGAGLQVAAGDEVLT